MISLALICLFLLVPAMGFSQTQSVMIEDLTSNEVADAIAGGKTTAIYYVGGAHASRAAVAIGKHNFLVTHMARRIAEELGNALVYPINPYAPAGDPVKITGEMKSPGTTSLSEETFAAVSKAVAYSAIAAGFKHVALMGDHYGGQDSLRKIALVLDAEWSSKGVRVFYVPVYDEGEGQMKEHLTRLNVPPDRQTPVDDASEVMAIDVDNRWVRKDQIPPEDARIVSAELGRTFIDNKIRSAVASIRRQVGAP
jgi:creatinine amidohydrolase